MKRLAVVLLSGRLDSTLAARILQLQGFEVVGLTVRLPFHRCESAALQAACELQIPLAMRKVEEDYMEVLRYPRHGYGKGANPCLDCRTYMLRMARQLMDELDGMLVATGEVLGQRPMSQKRSHLGITAYESGLQDRLLRPLSAKCLPPTLPEREGYVDREKLYAFTGRSRKPLWALARQLGLKNIPESGAACSLTDVQFAPKVFDLLDHDPQASLWDCELLTLGRHVRLDERTKLIIGRNEMQNLQLRRLFARRTREDCLLLTPGNFTGPDAILVGDVSEPQWEKAVATMLRYVHRELLPNVEVDICVGGAVFRRKFRCPSSETQTSPNTVL
ncbi:hypothetical protein [Thermogutta sp.]|uniref:hypothetical protein n=1 Tax=Thermogutta sp. TaxID=1962930 RepID=UPI003220684D